MKYFFSLRSNNNYDYYDFPYDPINFYVSSGNAALSTMKVFFKAWLACTALPFLC